MNNEINWIILGVLASMVVIIFIWLIFNGVLMMIDEWEQFKFQRACTRRKIKQLEED